MRIALFSLNFWPRRGGQEYVVHQLATALHRAGHPTSVFVPRVRGLREEIDHQYELVRFGTTLRGAIRSGLNRPVLVAAFARRHLKSRFDVVNAHSASTATTYALDLKRLFRVPVVVTCHGHDIQRFPELGYGQRLNPRADREVCRNLSRVDRVVSISGAIRDELVQLIPDRKIVSIPNGVDVAELEAASVIGWRGRLGLGDRTIVLCVGRNVRKKAFPTGIRAFAQATQGNPSPMLVHVGRGGESLQQMAYDLGIHSQFLALGELDRGELLSLYREADIFLSPAEVEGFPLANLEAMACGLPCVVTTGPGNWDSIEHGQNGWMVPVGDVVAMAEALRDLIGNPRRRRLFAESSRRRARSFDWHRVAGRYVEMFREAIETMQSHRLWRR
jgi:glycosyltransferase involved in cell wall biosynthesis